MYSLIGKKGRDKADTEAAKRCDQPVRVLVACPDTTFFGRFTLHSSLESTTPMVILGE